MAGGGDAAVNVFGFEQDDGWGTPPMVSKMRGIKLRQGQAVRLETPGGGGYGPPGERHANAVGLDVVRGLVSEEQADRDYPGWQEGQG